MQHQNKTKEFGRTANQRVALWRTMLGSLIMHGKITTTEAKAKELKNRIDKIINKAKNYTNKQQQEVFRELRKNIPLIAVKKLGTEYLKNFENKKSGYARVIKLAPRKSDGARMAIVEIIDKE
jgi:large subunit ribosomal protein L17